MKKLREILEAFALLSGRDLTSEAFTLYADLSGKRYTGADIAAAGQLLFRTLSRFPSPADFAKAVEEVSDCGSFVRDCIEEIPGTQTKASAIYREYVEWAHRNGIKHPFTKTRLGKKLRGQGYTSDHCRTGRIYPGIQIKTDYSIFGN